MMYILLCIQLSIWIVYHKGGNISNSFYYLESGTTSRTLFVGDGTDTVYFVLGGTEHGEQGVPVKITSEATPNKYADQFRGVVYDPREYGFTLLVKRDTAANLESSLATLRGYFDTEKGLGTIKRVTFGGNTRLLDCILAEQPKVTPQGPAAAEMELLFHADNPWWRSESATHVDSALNADTPVNISCANGGQIASWPVITVTGVWATSLKFTNTSGHYIQVNYTTANADDTVTIDCRPNGDYRRSVYYREHGTGTRVYLPITSASRYITIPTGTNNLVGVLGGAGTPDVDIDYFLYYGGLY